MAMHKPSAWIVCLESNDHIAPSLRKHNNVTARWIGSVVSARVRKRVRVFLTLWWSVVFRDYSKIMAVEMNLTLISSDINLLKAILPDVGLR